MIDHQFKDLDEELSRMKREAVTNLLATAWLNGFTYAKENFFKLHTPGSLLETAKSKAADMLKEFGQ